MSGQAASREQDQDSERNEGAETTRRGQATFTDEAIERRQAEGDAEHGLAVTEADEAPDDSAPEGVFGPPA